MPVPTSVGDGGRCAEDGVADLTSLSDIDGDKINRCLAVRYAHDAVYTYTGSILVAVNPYKSLDIYDQSSVNAYHDAKLGSLPPHVFALAEASYRSLKSDMRPKLASSNTNQSLVISGESGAGKTESTKFILEYLCAVTANISTWVQQQILEANTILEAFGNAKTIRNDNSSRFGRFMQVCFDADFKIKGCVIQDYLLEQSRIITNSNSQSERNYHVFYQLTAAAQRDADLADRFSLRAWSEFAYLQTHAILEGVDECGRFDSLRLAFEVLQMQEQQVDAIFAVLAAVLWLGNLGFAESAADGSEVAVLNEHEDVAIVRRVASLLGVDSECLQNVLLQRQIIIRGNVTEIPLKLHEAKENRHAVSKALYSRTFSYLVNHINKCTNPGRDTAKFIGILDIFGFENFEHNSFEQLCINYTNEKLHMFFNHYVFSIEQSIYREEGLRFSHIDFTDNSACVELIEKPPRCILKLLAEQCHMPGGCDAAYLTNLHAEFESHASFVKGDDRRCWSSQFGIRHYAGTVNYEIDGFVAKNRDSQQDVFFDMLSKSTKELIRELCDFKDTLSRLVNLEEPSSTGPSPSTASSLSKGSVKRLMTNKSKPTVSDNFRLQLQSLVDVLQSTNPWYVRCIKPNNTKAANFFDHKLVLDQLNYLGMLDIIRIRKQGFPVHYSSQEFLSRYHCLHRRRRLPKDEKEAIRTLMQRESATRSTWQMGKTKLFLRHELHELLEERRVKVEKEAATRLQSCIKGFVTRSKYTRRRKATLVIQKWYLSLVARRYFVRLRRATITIQAHLRGMFAREVADALREARIVEEQRQKKEMIEQEREKKRQKGNDNDDDNDKEDINSDNNEDSEDSEERKNSFAGLADIDSEVAERQQAKLSTLAEQLNPRLGSGGVDLDQLFNFLSADVDSESTRSTTERETTITLDDLDQQMSDLQNEIESLSNEVASLPPPPEDVEAEPHPEQLGASHLESEQPPPSPPPLPPPSTAAPSAGLPPMLLKPSLPEPEGPPPPPPVQNGYAFNTPVITQEARNPLKHRRRPNEPIYESIKPRPEPLGAVDNVRQSDKSMVKEVVKNDVDLINDHSNAAEARRNERVRRELERREQTTTTTTTTATPASSLTLEEFASKYFLQRESSSLASLVRHTTSSSLSSPHLPLEEPENQTLALRLWTDLVHYMLGQLKSNEEETRVLQRFVKCGIERQELRDEMYIQIVRQINDNCDEDQCERLWLLLCLVVVAFGPSKNLFKYLVPFLERQQRDGVGGVGFSSEQICQYVSWCLSNVSSRQVHDRRRAPSSVEITAMRKLGTIVCRFFFMDKRTKALDVHPVDTAKDILERIAIKIGLNSVQGFALYESNNKRERHIPQFHYLYDVIADWEAQEMDNEENTDEKEIKSRKTMYSMSNENRFVMKKRLFTNVKEIPSDPIEVSLLYAQAVHDVVEMDALPVSEKVALQLAGLQAQVQLGDPQLGGRHELYSDVSRFIPDRIRRARFISDAEWMPILCEAHHHFGSGKSEIVAKVWYLSCVMQYDLYGCQVFKASSKGFGKGFEMTNNMALAVGSKMLMVIKLESKMVMHTFNYTELERIEVDVNEPMISVHVRNDVYLANADLQSRVHVFEVEHQNELADLMVAYAPSIVANAKLESNMANKVANNRHVSNEERLRLHQNLINCRHSLIDSGLLNKPSQDEGSSNFLRNTLRRLSSKNLTKNHNNVGMSKESTKGGFDNAFFVFTKSPMNHTMLTMANEEEEQVALEVFQLILTYSGLMVNKNNEELDHVLLIQSVLERSMKKECLINELFLQLIKQTTDHPDPNSRINLRHWSLLALACSIILPIDKRVRKVLLAHLKKCSADFVTEEGKYARFAEKCFHKTLGTRRRQWAPSRQEILCTINRRPIYARFHFMDGQFHAIEFDPSATASEVLVLVMAKIGLRPKAEGYAIYEVLGTQERSLLADEKVADVMSKWEQYRVNAVRQQGGRHHMFLFKKHLFLDAFVDLNDPVEKELLYYQVLCDLRSDRFPVTDMEAVMLCALRAQIELGDFSSSSSSLDYRQVISHCLPPRLLIGVQADHVAMHHQSLLGMNMEEAKQAFLNLIQCWPLHKATLFDVIQSFTSNWPKALWMAVDQRGLHLLEHRTRNVLTSFEYNDLVDFTPSLNHLLIITCSQQKQSKIVVNTNQAFQIANLIREYMAVLQELINEQQQQQFIN